MYYRLATEEDLPRLDACIRSEWPDDDIGLMPNVQTLIFRHGFISFDITNEVFPTVQHFYIDPEYRATGERMKMALTFLKTMRAFGFAKIILILPKKMDRLANRIMQDFNLLPYDMNNDNWYLLIPTEV